LAVSNGWIARLVEWVVGEIAVLMYPRGRNVPDRRLEPVVI
jgi:hypothetical protein